MAYGMASRMWYHHIWRYLMGWHHYMAHVMMSYGMASCLAHWLHFWPIDIIVVSRDVTCQWHDIYVFPNICLHMCLTWVSCETHAYVIFIIHLYVYICVYIKYTTYIHIQIYIYNPYANLEKYAWFAHAYVIFIYTTSHTRPKYFHFRVSFGSFDIIFVSLLCRLTSFSCLFCVILLSWETWDV